MHELLTSSDADSLENVDGVHKSDDMHGCIELDLSDKDVKCNHFAMACPRNWTTFGER